jgi:putative molybdopterin biosynthesis protein
VASGRADCALGIPAAAKALDLDFIPLFQETYQLLIPKVFAQSDLFIPVLNLLNNRIFKQAVKNMPGYDVSQMGKLIMEVS